MTDYNNVLLDPAVTEGPMPRSRAAVFAAAVKRGRERLGISQDLAAERVGVRQQTWSGWEKGVSIPPPRRVATIAEVLKLDTTKLQQAAGHIPVSGETAEEPLPAEDDLASRLDQLDQLDQRTSALMELLSRVDARLEQIEKDLRRRGR